MDVFSLQGKIAVEYADAIKGLEKIGDTAEDAAKEVSNLGDSADDAGDQVENAGESAEKADGQFTTWKATLANLVADAIMKLIDKCAELGEEIVELGISTETSFAKLETIAGTENMDALTESITRLSQESGISSAELAEVAYNAMSAGASAEEACGRVEAATKLATAGFTDSGSALDLLSTIMNSYGDSAGDVTDISDSLIEVQNRGVTTIDKLAGAMGKSIATGSAYHVTLGNLESAYISMTKAGISTEESTTYLNSMMSELGDAGSDVAGVLQEKTGKSFTQLMDEGYSLSDVLQILYDSVDGDSTALMNLWGSQEAGKASNAIVNQGLDTFNENLEAVTGSAGATQAAYETMSDTMGHKMAVMKNDFEQLGLQIYDGLEEPLGSAIDFVTGTVIPGITKLVETFDKWAPSLAAITAGFIALKVQMGISALISALTTAWAAYQAANEGATVAQWLLNAAMEANPIGIIIMAISALVAGILYLWNTNEDFRNGVIEIWTAVSETAVAVFEAIKTFIVTAWTTVRDRTIAIWTAVSAKVSAVVNAIKNTINTVFNAAKAIVTTIWNAIKFAITDPIGFAKTTVDTAISAIKGFLGSVNSSTILGIFNDIKNGIKEKIEWARDKVEAAIDKIKGFFKFSWSLPSLKLPHFSVSGSFSLNPPSVPHFGVDWYAKAMQNPMVLTEPRAFGITPDGRIRMAGEAGDEVVGGKDKLMEYIGEAVAAQNGSMAETLMAILRSVQALDAGLLQKFMLALEAMQFNVNGREFARLVRSANGT